MKTYEEVS